MNKFNPQALKEKIKESGYRPSWLASQIGVSPQTMRAYMCGQRDPKKPVVKLLSYFLKTEEQEFYISGEAT
jgi:hypothetical protein